MNCENPPAAALRNAFLMTTALVCLSQSAVADPFALSVTGMVTSSSVNGAQVGAGSYSLQQLAAAGSAVGPVSYNGVTGIPLWSLLGGNAAGMSDVVTSTPAGDNGKNAILQSYVLATSITGAQSIISLGEIDPFFGGTGAVPDLVAFSGTDAHAELVFPSTGASGRNVVDLASLQILAAPALATGAGGPSTSLALTGNVAQPENYTLSRLQSLPATTETVSGDTYTGVSLWTLLNPTASNVLNQYVLASGTDGYEVLYSLAELDPAFGAAQDLAPYADSLGQFPPEGFARTVIPGANHQGRWISNLDAIEVVATPEPGTAFLLVAALVVLCLKRRLFVPLKF